MADEPAPPLPSSTQPARARRRRIFFGAALFHAALLALVTGAGAETVPPAGRIVVLISIGGFPMWIWKDPTLAELLGVTLPDVEGRVLREILK